MMYSEGEGLHKKSAIACDYSRDGGSYVFP